MNPSKLKEISIVDLLISEGYNPRQETSDRYRMSSPFASDSNPSFVIYTTTNRFKCYSTGKKGDVIDLVMMLHSMNYALALDYLNGLDVPKVKIKPRKKKHFSPEAYITNNDDIIDEVRAYAKSRKFTVGFTPAIVYELREGSLSDYEVKPAMMFVHLNKNFKPCGAKFRKINDAGRFTSRGSLNLYMLSNCKSTSEVETLYIMESETSALSMFEWLVGLGKKVVVCSFGGVSFYTFELPDVLLKVKRKMVLIDYDGNEELWQSRISFFETVGEVIKLELPKGEDINSLYVSGEIDKYKDILL